MSDSVSAESAPLPKRIKIDNSCMSNSSKTTNTTSEQISNGAQETGVGGGKMEQNGDGASVDVVNERSRQPPERSITQDSRMSVDFDPHYDKNLYSRQLFALGHNAMLRLRTAHVLISGMGGVGVEIAKNLILAGVGHITLHDTNATSWFDLSAQYYLTEKDVGTNRADVCYESLVELNDSVRVRKFTQPLTEQTVAKYDVVILTETPLSKQIQINEWVRAKGKKMLVADSKGLFALVFADFGPTFRIEDKNGESVIERHVENISREGIVTTLQDEKHDLEDGDYITFLDVKGMTALNECEPKKVKIINPWKVDIGDLSDAGDFQQCNARLRQVKMPTDMEFKSLAESLKKPAYFYTDFAKMESTEQEHVIWQAFHHLREELKRPPKPRNKDDSQRLIEIANQIGAKLDQEFKLDEDLARKFSYQACGNICPMASFVGGFAAQEALKAVTFLYTPINQWLYFDALECLPDEWADELNIGKLEEEDFQPRDSRYDGQACVFGWPFQEILSEQKWFLVGSGAIGCEMLKNFAMCGLGCGKNGSITVTDMDNIEVSNLNRQFLFRRHDVGQNKASCAARAIEHFNPTVNIHHMADRVGAETENVFNDAFFELLDGVANALDNVEARQYIDRRCLFYGLPLLESGTMGPKGNTQVVVPHLTESYSASADPPERDFPICTLRNFPNDISHTVQWARDRFEMLFTNPASTANQFISDTREFWKRLEKMHTTQKLEILTDVEKALIIEKPESAADCVKWARLLFQEWFHNTIAQMIHLYPPDHRTDEGVPFWSGSKRCPHPLVFDENNSEHIEFVRSASILRCQMYRMDPILKLDQIAATCKELQISEFVPSSTVKIATTDEEAEAQTTLLPEDSDDQIARIELQLAKLSPKKLKDLDSIDFEKDDDTNHHMEFVTSCSNLRAENYDIVKADHMKTRQLAGRIIPALATTTAAIGGLICLEQYKVISDRRKGRIPIEKIKNSFLNMALPFVAFSEPVKPEKKEYAGIKFTQWDAISLSKSDGVATFDDLIKYFKDRFKLNVTMISCGVSMIYAFFMNPAKQKERLNEPIPKVVESVSQHPIKPHVNILTLEIVTTDEADEDVETPYIKYHLEK